MKNKIMTCAFILSLYVNSGFGQTDKIETKSDRIKYKLVVNIIECYNIANLALQEPDTLEKRKLMIIGNNYYNKVYSEFILIQKETGYKIEGTILKGVS
jgi:hypothetical protein